MILAPLKLVLDGKIIGTWPVHEITNSQLNNNTITQLMIIKHYLNEIQYYLVPITIQATPSIIMGQKKKKMYNFI